MAYVLESEENFVLINCGGSIPNELHKLSLLSKITHAIILGNDEFIAGGVETLGIRTKYVLGNDVTLIKPPFLIKKISYLAGKKITLESLFSNSICFRTEALEIGNLTFKFFPVSESRAAVHVVDKATKRSLLITGETPKIEDQLVPLPYNSDLVIQSCVFENERKIARYQDFLDFKGNIRFTEYRDRDLVTGEKILFPGEKIEL